MVEARHRLAGIYAEAPDAAAARAQKAAEFARLAEALAAGGQPATGELNNARLVAVATYERCVPALRAELERLANDLPAFYCRNETPRKRPRPSRVPVIFCPAPR